MVKDRGQYIHIYANPCGKSPVNKLEWQTWLNVIPVDGLTLLFITYLIIPLEMI